MRGKTISTLEELDAEMTGNGKSATAGHKAAKKPKAKAAKATPKAEPKTAFRVHTMTYDDKKKVYGKSSEEHFDDLADAVAFVEKAIERGQGNGLHEVAIHVA